MTWAAGWPRRWTAAVLAALLPLLGALAIVGGAGAAGQAGEFFADSPHVDAIAPSRVVPVRHAVAEPQHLDRVDPPSAVQDSGPPRRAALPELPAPAAPAGSGVNATPAEVPENRGPPAVSAP